MAFKPTPPQADAIAWTVPEFCYLGRFGREAAYDIIKSGEVKATRIGRQHLIPVKAGREWFASKGLEVPA